MAVRSIEYDHSEGSIKYNSVQIHLMIGNREVKVFDTGDFVKDWFNSVKFVLTGGIGEYPVLSDSSSVNHFIMDGASSLYDSAWLVLGDEAELVYKYTEEGFELFVEGGTKPTWEELKQICK